MILFYTHQYNKHIEGLIVCEREGEREIAWHMDSLAGWHITCLFLFAFFKYQVILGIDDKDAFTKHVHMKLH